MDIKQGSSKIIPVDSTIPEGSYKVSVWVEDSHVRGLESIRVDRSVVVDKTKPKIEVGQMGKSMKKVTNIVGILMMAVILFSGNVAQASDPLYYYDKHTSLQESRVNLGPVETLYVLNYELQWDELVEEEYYHYKGVKGSGGSIGGDGYLGSGDIGGPVYSYNTYTIVTRTYEGDKEKVLPRWVYTIDYDSSKDSKRVSNGKGGNGFVLYSPIKLQVVNSVDEVYSKGAIVQSNIQGTANQYPQNGRHTDGYWYIRKGLVNNDPTLAITGINNGIYHSEVVNHNTVKVSGNISDANIGDNLVVKYNLGSLPGHQNKVIHIVKANGGNQQFTYDILVNSTITEGSHHLSIWVEDGNGGKSKEFGAGILVDKTKPKVQIKVK